ncbi:MAG: hypothetical protein ABI543_08650 [Ignavibacteria bacterium]
MRSVKLIIFLICVNTLFLYSQQPLKLKVQRKVPKVSISFSAGFGYVMSSANGDSRGFSSLYNTPNGHVFNSKNLGLQEGYGLGVTGRYVISKNKKVSLTSALGYNLFYNTLDKGMNRTKWNVFNLSAGVEYNFTPKQKESIFVGYSLDYNLMFGAWQSNVTYPDNSVSNIYTKFKPASRFGMSATAGMLIRLSRKTDFLVALKGVWVNVIPKQNYYTNEPYSTFMNDSGSSNGIELEGRKNIIYLQINFGVILPIRY